MSNDLRTALADLASEAPAIDVAERAITRGRARRRRWVLGTVAAAAVVAVAGPAAVGALDDRVLPNPAGTQTSPRFDPTVEVPWPWLRDLPRQLDEPLALAYHLNDESTGYEYRAVSVSGRQWLLPSSGNLEPTLSANGWKIAWQDVDRAELVVQDLMVGLEYRFPYGMSSQQERALGGQVQAPWSPDSRYLALNAHNSRSGLPITVVIDSEDGTEIDIRGSPHVFGWQDDDTMLGFVPVSSESVDGAPLLLGVEAIELNGRRQALSSFDWPDGIGTNHAALSTDGTRLAAPGTPGETSGTGGATTIELDSGTVTTADCFTCSGVIPTAWASPSEITVRDMTSDQATQRVLALDVDTGATRTLISFSPRLPEVSVVSVATGVMAAGPAGTPHIAGWWPGWYLDWIGYGLIGTLLLVLVIVRTRRRAAELGT